MKRLENWRSFDEFGIDLLTGESCGHMFQYLCDVTARGKRIIEKCLDCELKLHENWNRGGPNDPHIGSVMLSPHFFAPLAVFALLDNGFAEVWILKSGTVVGIEKDEDPERSKVGGRLTRGKSIGFSETSPPDRRIRCPDGPSDRTRLLRTQEVFECTAVGRLNSWQSDLTLGAIRITMRVAARCELLLRSLNPSVRVS